MIQTTPGQTRTITISDLYESGGGSVIGGSGAIVIFRLTDASGTQTGSDAAASAATGSDDWSAEIIFPLIPGPYTLTAYVDTGDGETIAATESIAVRARKPHNALTRRELVQRIAWELNDRTDVVATATGSVSTLISQRDLNVEPDYLAGREIVCMAGHPDNLGEVCIVITNSRSTKSLTFEPSLPQATVSGDRFLLVNNRGVGWKFWEYHEAINAAIQDTWGYHLSPVHADLTAVHDTQDRVATIVLPSHWSHFSGLEAGYPNAGSGETYRGPLMGTPINGAGVTRGNWRSIPTARSRGDSGAYLLDGYGDEGRTVELSGDWRYHATHSGATVRAKGYVNADLLQSDDDWTTITAEWLVPQVAARMLRSGLDRRPEREGLASYMQQLGNGLRGLARTPVAPNTMILPG